MRAAVDGRSLPATGAVRDRASVLAALRTRRACLVGAAAKHICARTPPRLRSRQERVCLLDPPDRSEEHTSELQSLMRISYAVFCLQKKNNKQTTKPTLSISHTQ